MCKWIKTRIHLIICTSFKLKKGLYVVERATSFFSVGDEPSNPKMPKQNLLIFGVF